MLDLKSTMNQFKSDKIFILLIVRLCVMWSLICERGIFNHNNQKLEGFFVFNLAALSLRCCMGFSLVGEDRGYSLVVVCRLLIAVASLVVEHRL